MCAGGCSPPREHFSLGQAFRMNTQADEWGGTMLIANGLRPGPGQLSAADYERRLPATFTRLEPALGKAKM